MSWGNFVREQVEKRWYVKASLLLSLRVGQDMQKIYTTACRRQAARGNF